MNNYCTAVHNSAYLLFSLQEPSQVVRVQVVLVVAVGKHKEVQVPAGGHHLVEVTELLEAQGPLVVVCVGLLCTDVC